MQVDLNEEDQRRHGQDHLKKMKENGLTWAQVEHLVQNRGGWQSLVLVKRIK